MADLYSIKLDRLDIVTAALAQAPDIVRDEMNQFLYWATILLQGEVVDRAPENDGTLRQSIKAWHEVSETGILGIVGTSLNYALPVEIGTKPHPVSYEGIEALKRWAKRKLPLGQRVSAKTGRPLKTPGIDEAAEAAARAIAWKILHHGTEGHHMFYRAFVANAGRVRYRFQYHANRIVARIGGLA